MDLQRLVLFDIKTWKNAAIGGALIAAGVWAGPAVADESIGPAAVDSAAAQDVRESSAGETSTDDETESVSSERLIARVMKSVVTITTTGRDGQSLGVGTGFVIDPKGWIATNFHVIGEGRPMTVKLPSGDRLPVTAVHASDRVGDLAILKVDLEERPVPPLTLSEEELPPPGRRVFAVGNPLGLENSVVEGIVSAVRRVEGKSLIQLAMPIEPGNSGGPVIDAQGRVLGIVNMKSAVDDNLGFAIPVSRLQTLLRNPNPVGVDRWVRLGSLDPDDWTIVADATWQRRGGRVTARGRGTGFGGRSLCLSTEAVPTIPYEIAVKVALDDESGAAGLAFHSDGSDRHYGFYPSNGRLRLTCFQGPSVFTWKVLQEVESPYYLPGQTNRLRVRMEQNRLACFVNGHLVIESKDRTLTKGRAGLVKFRDTMASFRSFEIGKSLATPEISEDAREWMESLFDDQTAPPELAADRIATITPSSGSVARELRQHAQSLEKRAEQFRRLAADVSLLPPLESLRKLVSEQDGGENEARDDRLLRGSLLIAKLDDPDIDVDAYVDRIHQMAEELRSRVTSEMSGREKCRVLDEYLFRDNGFRGGRTEYDHPANSHLHRVIDDREGLPITLSILYMELGRSIGLQMEGVGLPGHFVVRRLDSSGDEMIDVFDRGERMSPSEIRRLVFRFASRPLREEDLAAQSTLQILQRVINNLIAAASERRDLEAMRRYAEALVAIEPESSEAKMLRARVSAVTGRRASARRDLQSIADQSPQSSSGREAAKLLRTLDELPSR